MSWIKLKGGDLLNLDFINSIDVNELAEPELHDGDTHAVFANEAQSDEQTHYILFTGDEEYCRQKCEQIANKLPLVKP